MKHPLHFKEKKALNPSESLDRFLAYLSEKQLELYPAQEEAILEIFNSHNVILNTPTGSGKSLVAMAMHYASLTQKRRSFYTSPIKALVNEKFFDLCRAFGPDRVGLMTGDGSVNAMAPIICCTAEVLANMALREGEYAIVDDVVVDEFHYYSDRDRGSAWQIPLLTLPQCRFLLMSATLGPTDFFEEELTRLNDKKTVIVRSQDRPVPLNFSYRETPLEETVSDLLLEQKAPIYIVNFTQRECAELAQSFMSMNFCSKEEKKAISDALAEEKFSSPYGKEMRKFLKHGIGIHHAGLLPKYRILVERLAQRGLLKLILGTDTLGVGVNVPIRTVLFTKLCKFDGEKTSLLTVRDFHQISGRAGRKGFDKEGFVVVQAPAHVIENKRLELKAKLNPKKKLVRAKPPEKGFINWGEDTFKRLIESSAEKLTSRFSINHGMLLNVLSRRTDGCKAMKTIVRSCHDSDKVKIRHRRLSFQLLRSLLDRKIVEFIPKEERTTTPIRVNMILQDDFSLNQTLALYMLDALKFLDPMEEGYSLKVLTLVESILENPKPILQKQLDAVRQAKFIELKESGVEFEERVAELEKLEYPKPMADFIYSTFNQFADKHPWVGQENIKPKSIAREMVETFQSFADYVRSYHLERMEGLLLRHLSSVYRTLLTSIPDDLKNDELDEIATYLEAIIKSTDSSLVDEWQRMRDPNWVKQNAEGEKTEEKQEDITANKRLFTILIRNSAFSLLKDLARKNYEKVMEHLWLDSPENKAWNEEKLSLTMEEYYKEHAYVRTDAQARAPINTVIRDTEDPNIMSVEVILIDPQNFNDWSIKLSVDLAETRKDNEVAFKLLSIEPV